jgi:hypothetical protein
VNYLNCYFPDFLIGQRQFQVKCRCGSAQSLDIVLEVKEFPVVGAPEVENAISPLESQISDTDYALVFWLDLTVHITKIIHARNDSQPLFFALH